MKKPAIIIIVVIALVATLAFLRQKVGEFNNAEHERFQIALWQIKQLDTTFNEDVLKSRFALVDNYDDFQVRAAEMARSLETLRQSPAFITPAGRTAIAAAHAQYINLLVERQKLFERFKTQNSRVSNSRRYLPGALEELATRLAAGSAFGADNLALQSVTADISRLLLQRLSIPDDVSEDAPARLQQLRDWCADHPDHPEARFAGSLVRHAENIIKGNSAVDALTRELLALPTNPAIETLFRAYETEVSGALGRTQQFRVILYVLGGVMLLGLTYTFWALRAANRNLENRVRARTVELEDEISERKKIEETLQRQQTELRVLFDLMPAMIWFKDTKNNHLRVNKQVAESVGKSVAAIEGKPCHEIYPNEAAKFYADDLEVMRSKSPKLGYVESLRDRQGEVRWVETDKVPYCDKDGNVIGIVVMAQDITERKRADEKLKDAHRQLLEISRQAGMAEVATSVLHNVGNVLNSVNVSANWIAEGVRKSRAMNLAKVVTLLRAHETDLGNFLVNDQKGRQIPAYLAQLTDHIAGERVALQNELATLQQHIDHIKEIVTMQQNYATVSGVKETLTVTELVEDALRLNAGSLTHHGVQVIREFTVAPVINIEKHKALQILVNLVRNAKQACDAARRDDKQMTLRILNGSDRVRISVIDNGVGIAPENLTRIFNHGFTTKKEGHGFGLHNAANAAKEMGGNLLVHSDGPDTGATFTLELPVQPGEHRHV